MADPNKVPILQRFFKTKPGQYGEGDIFIGVMVPQSRQVAKKFSQLPLGEVKMLLYSCIHEERLVALLILAWRYRYSASSSREKVEIVKFYLDNIKQVNNWDLVDLSAPNILGAHLVHRDRRLAVQACQIGERMGTEDSYRGHAPLYPNWRLFRHTEDCGDAPAGQTRSYSQGRRLDAARSGQEGCFAEEAFLEKHCSVMPRTMLRYAIERLPESKRRHYKKADG